VEPHWPKVSYAAAAWFYCIYTFVVGVKYILKLASVFQGGCGHYFATRFEISVAKVSACM
jgi:hypothetical protein